MGAAGESGWVGRDGEGCSPALWGAWLPREKEEEVTWRRPGWGRSLPSQRPGLVPPLATSAALFWSVGSRRVSWLEAAWLGSLQSAGVVWRSGSFSRLLPLSRLFPSPRSGRRPKLRLPQASPAERPQPGSFVRREMLRTRTLRALQGMALQPSAGCLSLQRLYSVLNVVVLGVNDVSEGLGCC